MYVLYSSTVYAANEANIYNIASIAVSAEYKDGKACYEIGAKYSKDVLERSKENSIGNNIVLNVNTPYLDEEEVKGIQVCKIGEVIYYYYFIENDNDND